MSAAKIERNSIGRIAERIVANELEYNGFLVRDLNLEGMAANVDLLAAKDKKIWQIQVKGARFDRNYENNGWWFHYGYCKAEHISNPEERVFNKAAGPFRADIVVLVSVRSPHEYQCIVLPVEKAEEAAQINLRYAYRTSKKDGSPKKPGIIWMAFYLPETTDERKKDMQREIEILESFRGADKRGKWDFDETVVASSFMTIADQTPLIRPNDQEN